MYRPNGEGTKKLFNTLKNLSTCIGVNCMHTFTYAMSCIFSHICIWERKCCVPLLVQFIPIYTFKERMRHMLFSRFEERNEEDEYCLSHSAVDLISKKKDGIFTKIDRLRYGLRESLKTTGDLDGIWRSTFYTLIQAIPIRSELNPYWTGKLTKVFNTCQYIAVKNIQIQPHFETFS